MFFHDNNEYNPTLLITSPRATVCVLLLVPGLDEGEVCVTKGIWYTELSQIKQGICFSAPWRRRQPIEGDVKYREEEEYNVRLQLLTRIR